MTTQARNYMKYIIIILLKRIAYIGLAVVIVCTSLPIQALAIDEKFYSSNDILFYNPDDPGTTCATGLGSGTFTTSQGADNLERILRFFVGKGLGLAAAAGIAGNWQQESTLNPAIIQGGSIAPNTYTPVNGVGFGLAQWTYTDRQKPLVDFAKKNNQPVTNLDVQLNFAWWEMTESPTLKETSVALAKETDPVHAAYVFHKIFERSADTEAMVAELRGKPATEFYNKYKSIITSGSSVSGSGSSSDCGGGAGTSGKDDMPWKKEVGACIQATGKACTGVGWKNTGTIPGQCAAFAAWRMAQQWYGSKLKADGSNIDELLRTSPIAKLGSTINGGNGNQTATRYIDSGVATKVANIKDAQPGDIVSMNSRTPYGHVYVILSNTNGVIMIEDYNASGGPGKYGTAQFGKGYYSESSIIAIARVHANGGNQ